MAWSQSSLFINMATVSDSSWKDFFSGLVNILDICKNYSFNVNLDFPSAAILFNQLDITVSVLRIVSDGVANLSLPCINQLQELCSCFSEIHLCWKSTCVGNRKNNHKYSQFGSTFCRYSGVGRPKFEIAQELLENLRDVLFVDYG